MVSIGPGRNIERSKTFSPESFMRACRRLLGKSAFSWHVWRGASAFR
jgi:hypothetical protein